MKRNKLIVIMAVVCVLTLAVTLFAGCKGKKLDAPEISYNESNRTFSWEAVEGANAYKVYFNDEANEFTLTVTSVSIDNAQVKGLIDKQENIIYVKAVEIDEEGNVAAESKAAELSFDYMAPTEVKWTVTFNLNYTGAPAAETKKVNSGDKFDKPADPKRDGFTFGGWFRDEACLLAADFDANGKSTFAVTANLPLYAKWTENEPATTVTVYLYSESSAEIKVQPSKGETKLYADDGIAMTAVSGKENWFKAEIDDSATSVIFVTGEQAGQSMTFDKSKPYCKDGAWTATMPDDVNPLPIPEGGVVLIINGDTAHPVALQKNENPEDPNVTQEYMGTVTLSKGDVVKIMEGEFEYVDYETACPFQGTASADGDHEFYVKRYQDGGTSVWVKVPSVPTPEIKVVLIINGKSDDAKTMTAEVSDDANVTQQYAITITLSAGDTVEIWEGDFQYVNYEPGCKFTGTVTVEGEHTFYAKKYQDGGDSVWVTAPEDPNPTPTPTPGTFAVYVIVNGKEADKTALDKNESIDPTSTAVTEYWGKIALKANDTVVLKDSNGFEYLHYEATCDFKGTATVDGDYTFYAKRYDDDKDGELDGDSIWVAVPDDFVVPAKAVKLYFWVDSTWANNWSEPKAYCWKETPHKENASFPGETMTSLGNGWFMLEIDEGFDMVIFSGAPGNKSEDLSLVVENGVAYMGFYGAIDQRPEA